MAKKQEKETYGRMRTAADVAGQRAAQTFAPAQAGYEEFSKTGGVSPEEANLARRQTSYGISSLYDAMKRNLGRRGRIQGGYAPGLAAGEAQLGRQGAEQVAKGLTGTNLGLLEMQRQGRLAGLGGLGGLYGASSGQQSGLLGMQSNLAARMKGPWSNFLEGVGTIGGAAADVIGALG